MAQKYFGIVTDIGNAAFAEAAFLGVKLNIVKFVAGDGGGLPVTPSADMTALVRQVWEGDVSVSINPQSPNIIDARVTIPPEIGGFTVREMGILDDRGRLIAVANSEDLIKPIQAEGSTAWFRIGFSVAVSNIDVINVQVNPWQSGVVFSATRPDGDWQLWMQDQGAVDMPGGEEALPRQTAPLGSPGDFAVLDDAGDGEAAASMAAHKARAVGRAADGTEVTLYLETIAEQVLCTVPDETAGEPSTTRIKLDELLSKYAHQINENSQAALHAGIELSEQSIPKVGTKMHMLALERVPVWFRGTPAGQPEQAYLTLDDGQAVEGLAQLDSGEKVSLQILPENGGA